MNSKTIANQFFQKEVGPRIPLTKKRSILCCGEEKAERESSDFLKYVDSQGKYADFHGLRHTFVTNLARANVSPKMAQTLARHSDIKLTMSIYSHVAPVVHWAVFCVYCQGSTPKRD